MTFRRDYRLDRRSLGSMTEWVIVVAVGRDQHALFPGHRLPILRLLIRQPRHLGRLQLQEDRILMWLCRVRLLLVVNVQSPIAVLGGAWVLLSQKLLLREEILVLV